MATLVTWHLNLEEVEIGKEVELIAEGLSAFEELAVIIQKPNGASFVWGVQSNEQGRVRDKIKLDSGLGQYLFCPKPACGYVTPHCRPINVCPCGVSKTDCNIKIDGPSQILKRTEISYLVTNLLPSRAITAKISNNQQVSYDLNGVSTPQGTFTLPFQHAMAGTYSLTISDGSCTSAPKIIEVVNSQNEIPVFTAVNSNPCAAGIDLFLQFNKSSYAHDERGHIRATICNKGPEFRQVSLATSLVLPDAFITSMPLPPLLGLPGYKCEEYVILFTAGTADTSYTANLFGSYECDGKFYTANGGSTNAMVGDGTGVCTAILQYFGTVSGGTTATTNDEVEIELTVFNTGNQILDSFSLNQLNLPENVAYVTALPVHSAPINPGQAGSTTVKIKPTNAGTYTIQLPPGGLTYQCGVSIMPLNSPGYVTLTVAD